MKKYNQMESEIPLFKFKSNDFIHGIIVQLVDNNPYSKLTVDIWIDSLFTGSFEVPHCADINDDCFGSDTSIFRTNFKSFKTSGTIIAKISTKLLYNDQITLKLLTNKSC